MQTNSRPRAWDDLAAQADALLRCGTDFWLVSGLGLQVREQLRSRLAAARDRECAFCGALALRLEATVRRQAVQHEAYDFLSECRCPLRDLPATERLRVPAEAEEQIWALQDAATHLRAPHAVQLGLGQTADMVARAEQLQQALELASENVELSNGALRAAATAQGFAIDRLHELVTSISHRLRARLRNGDPRWLTLTLVGGKQRPQPTPSEAATPSFQSEKQLRLEFESLSSLRLADPPPRVVQEMRARRGDALPRPSFGPSAQQPMASLKLTSALALLFPPLK